MLAHPSSSASVIIVTTNAIKTNAADSHSELTPQFGPSSNFSPLENTGRTALETCLEPTHFVVENGTTESVPFFSSRRLRADRQVLYNWPFDKDFTQGISHAQKSRIG